ncbi:MAG: Permease of the major facilitator superfamily [Candidatus Nomurabacteria bacterium GW2011_GWF2_35_66]|uniref:Permease of the major facilitator superfamily n=1 Tax=Candidatus Nomurabacteria bacterium GW2011_GWE1_35_16 TaxID=1618761 RepID=A0A0G0EGE9_9BACT|nr:MAG: Permease of the major facilitator superfamily [Candidatus Nomurabacteria bacterium GW2011_GWF1_34_20]KKP63003.1 MAG: Permease of the major facilitator superfamily [Candidatus Nomurabacteria bacterium GW2011_GWE2_34_25]KKP66407.1 MAG: Permease of the major facilitator superfamily [Candidatus Nomurabacteria bacterium GW2011_GWE1_35_16]KKP83153.1 MAG: Permease of the major facilitator superfamily [Candidatus Nomurabacteria bacterium GW2011_GWF2_35_66]HAE36504.1 hypothetical protein [Candid
MNKIKLWYLYDFANSFASVVLLFYYPLILSERGASDIWIGVSASISTAVLLIILPYLGSLSDKIGKRVLFIKIGSMLMVISLILISFIIKGSDVFDLKILFILSFLYILFQICWQGSYSIYTAMLRQISDETSRVKISGQGYGFGQLGNALAIVIISAIIGTSVVFLGLSGKVLALFLGALFFLLLTSLFFFQKESTKNDSVNHFSYKEFFKKIKNNKRVFYFLIGYSLLADALLTFQLYIALYVSKVFDFSDKGVSYVAVIGLVFAMIGGFITSIFVKKLKNKNRALIVAGLSYGVSFGLCALMPVVSSAVFIVVALSGLFFGILFSLFRVIYSEISPMDSQGEFFSIFTVFEKAASVVGPLVWLLTFYLLRSFGESIQYRGSVLLLMIICFIGIYYLKKSEKFS